jgi:hypothetical protein
MTEGSHAHLQGGSFLVRCWLEPREPADQPGVLRVYVRNLRTGEEHYIGSPSEVGELLERNLRVAKEETESRRGFSRSEAG